MAHDAAYHSSIISPANLTLLRSNSFWSNTILCHLYGSPSILSNTGRIFLICTAWCYHVVERNSRTENSILCLQCLEAQLASSNTQNMVQKEADESNAYWRSRNLVLPLCSSWCVRWCRVARASALLLHTRYQTRGPVHFEVRTRTSF